MILCHSSLAQTNVSLLQIVRDQNPSKRRVGKSVNTIWTRILLILPSRGSGPPFKTCKRNSKEKSAENRSDRFLIFNQYQKWGVGWVSMWRRKAVFWRTWGHFLPVQKNHLCELCVKYWNFGATCLNFVATYLNFTEENDQNHVFPRIKGGGFLRNGGNLGPRRSAYPVD